MKVIVSTIWLLTLSLQESSFFLPKAQLECIWLASGDVLQQRFPRCNGNVSIAHRLWAAVICKRALKYSVRGAWFHFLFNFLAEEGWGLLWLCSARMLLLGQRNSGLVKCKKGAICVVDADGLPVPLGSFVMAFQKKDLLYWTENWRNHCVFSSVQHLWLGTTTQAPLDRRVLQTEAGSTALWPAPKGSLTFTYGISGNEEEIPVMSSLRLFILKLNSLHLQSEKKVIIYLNSLHIVGKWSGVGTAGLCARDSVLLFRLKQKWLVFLDKVSNAVTEHYWAACTWISILTLAEWMSHIYRSAWAGSTNCSPQHFDVWPKSRCSLPHSTQCPPLLSGQLQRSQQGSSLACLLHLSEAMAQKLLRCFLGREWSQGSACLNLNWVPTCRFLLFVF